MALLGIDLGGTKLTLAIFSQNGDIIHKETLLLEDRTGSEVGKLITENVSRFLQLSYPKGTGITSIGISVPGISHSQSGTVWAPNIPGWTDYPLLEEISAVCPGMQVTIDSDRACYILGESWQGNACGCRDAVYLSVGTGIGAGILVNGEVLRGSNDIAGCIGWMALQRPFDDSYTGCGCFEHFASGEGIAKSARNMLKENKVYTGELTEKDPGKLTASDVFSAYNHSDPLAMKIIGICIEFWGMAVANLVSLFNPRKIIIGGGVFGPAITLIPAIAIEAAKWAQPVGIKQVNIESSALAGDAGVYGAGFLALKNSPEYDQSK